MGDSYLDAIYAIDAACAGLSTDDALNALESLWRSFATHARKVAYERPGGFFGERPEQLARLEQLRVEVATAEPDLDLATEPLDQDGEAALRRVLDESDRARDSARRRLTRRPPDS